MAASMIAIVNYGIGNLDSVARAFRKVGAEPVVTTDASALERADGIVLPGVGSFDQAMNTLREHGLVPVLHRRAIEGKTPVLGICLGMQMFARRSEEGETEGLGWLDAETVRFSDGSAKIPHLGWNDVQRLRDSALFNGIRGDAPFYFAHSYHVVCRDENDVLARTDYAVPFVSAVERGNLFGTQFHPEKSHANGLCVVHNFVKRCAHA
ncbi:MAG TPA: imidazole glycerol phosphate synthase subunit HisH [Candidatus Hydrogenedentes bacterium]|nr:imidazole glycerol phosphate synthase subunit HisH [Candidatus Hydrogenedentota bacterium]HRT20109.1 imidazole glycerol phosphate synthase subunit HisH [Candidatus Hydrogenedentota bacterium]HRT64827.1 imidazole glycerol phosphate synthase subunit HisH [Candidatus Hydrogenedentota bacterium]